MINIGETHHYLFIWIISFWTILLILSNVFEEDLTISGLSDIDPSSNIDIDQSKNTINKILDNIFNVLDEIPIINLITPLLKIMTFQVNSPDNYLISLLLNFIAILTALVIYLLTRKG